jgi:hypothetical protein
MTIERSKVAGVNQSELDGQPPHFLSLIWRGLWDSMGRGAFWVAIAFYGVAGAITYLYPDKSLFSLDKLVYGLATITAVFNWGRSTQQEQDKIEISNIQKRFIDDNYENRAYLIQQHREQIGNLEGQIRVQTGWLQKATQLLNESLYDAENRDDKEAALPERLKMLIPQLSQGIFYLSELCGESPIEREERQGSVEKVLNRNTGITHRISTMGDGAQVLLSKLTADAKSEARLLPELKAFLASVIKNSSTLTTEVRETSEAVAVLDKKTRVPTDVGCPNCRARNSVMLGQYSGASAQGTCGTCERMFNAHNSADGPFTVAAGINNKGSVSPSTFVKMKCPNQDCSEPPFKVATIAGDARKEERGCFGCGAVMEIDLATRTTKLIEAKSKKKGRMADEKLVCIEDNSPVSFALIRTDGRVGYCRLCRTVVSTESGF